MVAGLLGLGLWCALLFLVLVLGDCDLMVFVNSVVLIDSLWYCVLLFADVLVVFGRCLILFCW